MSKDSKSFNGRAASQGPPKSSSQPAKNNRRRRGGRNRRRKNNKRGGGGGGPKGPMYGPYMAPSAISMPTPTGAFFKSSGSVRHKEYALGERFTGSCTYGSLAFNTANNGVLTMYDQDPHDMYRFYAHTTGLWFPIHPTNVPRLNVECLNWGRYTWRWLRIRFRPASSSNTGQGFVFTMLRDPSFPFLYDAAGSVGEDRLIQVNEMIQCTPAAVTSVWQPAQVELSNFTGERVFPTAAPTVNNSSYSTDPGGTGLADIAEEYYQFILGMGATYGVPASASNFGYIELDYSIDFYQPRLTMYNYLTTYMPYINTSGTSESSSSKSSTSSMVRPGHFDLACSKHARVFKPKESCSLSERKDREPPSASSLGLPRASSPVSFVTGLGAKEVDELIKLLKDRQKGGSEKSPLEDL